MIPRPLAKRVTALTPPAPDDSAARVREQAQAWAKDPDMEALPTEPAERMHFLGLLHHLFADRLPPDVRKQVRVLRHQQLMGQA